MKQFIYITRQGINSKLQVWAQERVMGIFIFTIILTLLLLLYSAGYFAPYLPLTINLIVVVALILAVILLHLNSNFIFFVVIFFWVLTSLFMVFDIDVWAERAAIYSFETLIIGIVLLVMEINFFQPKKQNE